MDRLGHTQSAPQIAQPVGPAGTDPSVRTQPVLQPPPQTYLAPADALRVDRQALGSALPVIGLEAAGWAIDSASAKGSAKAGAKGPTQSAPPKPATTSISQPELARLGKTDKQAFFKALLPGALESERKYGVPASVVLAQAAYESGWGAKDIGGNNLFGIKGSGPAGTVQANTAEYRNGQRIKVKANFAKFHSVAEAVAEHGKLFVNGRYDKALSLFAKTKDPFQFAKAIAPTYATSPKYFGELSSIMRKYGLSELAKTQGGH